MRFSRSADVRDTLQNLQAKLGASPRPLPSDLLSLIRGILRGRLRIVGSVTTPESSTLWLAAGPEGGDLENPRRARVTEAILRGELPKALAARMVVSRSTISSDVMRTIRRVCGGNGSVYRVPMALALLAHAAHGAPVAVRVEGNPWCQRAPFCSVRIERPDAALESRVSPAEYAIVRLILEGRAQSEMAEIRRTSPRTIANQSHAIFDKLRVSGRFSLLGLAIASAVPAPIQRARASESLLRFAS